MARVYSTFQLSDAALLSAFNSIAITLGARTSPITIKLLDREFAQHIVLPISDLETREEIQEILKIDLCLIGTITLSVNTQGSSVTLQRAETVDNVTITPRKDLPFPEAVKLISAVQKQLRPFVRDESFDKLLGDELAEFYRKREQALLRLENVLQANIERNEEYRHKLDNEAHAVRQVLEAKCETRLKELQSVYEKKEHDLGHREAQLNQRLEQIDDRDTRHARRQIRNDLKDAIAKRSQEFTLTLKTRQKRIPVHVVFIALVALLAQMLVYSLSHQPGTPEWFHLVRLPLLAAGTAAALIYYIRWNDAWFRKHADEEFRTKRFELDVDRASWLVEMALEWKEQKGTEIPRELLDRLSVNLFDAPSDSVPPRHPSEDVASAIVNACADLNFSIPGLGAVHLDRRATKELKKSIENGPS